jgi:hypothetical protein
MVKGRSRPGLFEDSGGSEKRGRKELVGDKSAVTSRDRRGRRGGPDGRNTGKEEGEAQKRKI